LPQTGYRHLWILTAGCEGGFIRGLCPPWITRIIKTDSALWGSKLLGYSMFTGYIGNVINYIMVPKVPYLSASEATCHVSIFTRSTVSTQARFWLKPSKSLPYS
jgi:hypothetical protein